MIGSSAPYDIVRREEVCAATGRVLEPGERHIAALVETPDDQALVRVLYSLGAWESGARPEPPAGLFGYWARVAGEGSKPAGPVISQDELFDLFEQLAEADQPRRIGFRYLLALMLMRKRRLVFEGAVPGDPKRLRLKARPGGAIYEVIDPGMDEEAIARATEELGRVIRVEERA